MKTYNWFLSLGLIGILLYLFLPGYLKIISFLLPALFLSYIFSKPQFNWYIFLALAFLYLLLPSSLFTLDSSNPFNINATVNFVENIIRVAIVIFAIAIPILALIGAIWAYVKGDPEKGTATVVKVLIVVIVVWITLFFGSMLGWKLYNLELLRPIYEFIWNFIKGIGNGILKIIEDFDRATFGIFFKREDIQAIKDASRMTEDIELLSAIDSAKTVFLSISSIYPVLLCLFLIIFGFFIWLIKKEPGQIETEKKPAFQNPLQLEFSFLIVLIIILISSFILYLTFESEEFLTYRNIGFFTIYLIIIVVILILLTLGISNPTKIDFKNSTYGIIFGISILFIYLNMFTQARTLDLVDSEYNLLAIDTILSQFLFVGPAESLLFHVFIPGLVIFYYQRKVKVSLNSLSLTDISFTSENPEISELMGEIENFKSFAEIQIKLGNKKEYLQTQKLLDEKKKKLQRLLKKPFKPRELTTDEFIIFLVVSFISNILFSMLHWFKSSQTFILFWSSGLGFLYLSAGMILTLISYRFGWLSCILSHSIYNTLTLLILFIGGI